MDEGGSQEKHGVRHLNYLVASLLAMLVVIPLPIFNCRRSVGSEILLQNVTSIIGCTRAGVVDNTCYINGAC